LPFKETGGLLIPKNLLAFSSPFTIKSLSTYKPTHIDFNYRLLSLCKKKKKKHLQKHFIKDKKIPN